MRERAALLLLLNKDDGITPGNGDGRALTQEAPPTQDFPPEPDFTHSILQRLSYHQGTSGTFNPQEVSYGTTPWSNNHIPPK